MLVNNADFRICFFYLFLVMVLSINLKGLIKQRDHYNCRDTGHDNSSINEIVEISFRTNRHGLFLHPSTVNYLTQNSPIVIVYFHFQQLI